MSERIRRRADGCPALTKRQTQRVHTYAVELVQQGHSRRRVSLLLLASALCEVTAYARGLVRHNAQLLDTAAQLLDNGITIASVPKSIVVDMAITIATKLRELPNDTARDAYIRALLGDDDDASPVIPSDHTGRTH